MKRTHYLILSTAGLSVAATAALVSGGTKLTATAAPAEVAFTRVAIEARTANQRGKGGAASAPDPRALGVLVFGLLATAGRLSIEERRRASATGLPTSETLAPAQ